MSKAASDFARPRLTHIASYIGLPRVLVVGPGRNQVGGVPTFVEFLLSSDALNASYELIHLDTSRASGDIGLEAKFSVLNVKYLARQVMRFIEIAIRCRPQIAHLQVTSYLAFWKAGLFMLVGRALGMKVLMHLHGGLFDQYYRQSSPRARRFIGWVLSRADIVIALSSGWRHFLLTEVGSNLRIEVVPNTVDTMFAEGLSKGAGITQISRNAVLFVGSLGQRKGVFDILRAVPIVRAQQPETRFLFAGNEETRGDRARIDKLCADAQLGDAVQFLGQVTGYAKLDLFRQAMLFILPSYGENLPFALLEAMATGLPVITTRVGAIPEIVEDGYNGFLINPGDHVTLARRIIQLLEDPALRLSMSQANIDRIRNDFMPSIAITRLGSLYAQLLAGLER